MSDFRIPFINKRNILEAKLDLLHSARTCFAFPKKQLRISRNLRSDSTRIFNPVHLLFKRKKSWILFCLGAVILIGIISGTVIYEKHQTLSWIKSVLPPVPESAAANQWAIEPIRQADHLARKDVSGKDLGELAQIYQANGYPGEATQVYDALIQLHPDMAKWPYLLADILSGYGQAEEAITLLNRTLELSPETVPAHLRLGEIYQQTNQPEKARIQFEAALMLEPDNLHARVGIARVEMDAERWEKAIVWLKQVTRLKPDFGAAWALLETSYTQAGDGESAANARLQNTHSVSFYDIVDPWKNELLQYCYDPYRLRIAASTPRLDLTTDESISLLERAISLNPQDADIHRQIGLLLTRIGRFDSAETHFEEAIELEPKNPDGWAYLVNLYNEWRRLEQAERTTIDGLIKCPDSPALHLEWGRQLVRKGELRQALKAFQTMNRMRPEEASGYIEIARVYFRMNLIERGLEHMRKALLAEPGNAVALTTLALNAIQSGNEQESVEWMEKAKAQPKVPKADILQLQQQFESKFGRSIP